MHVHNWAHYKSFISLLSFPSTCLSFLIVFLSFRTFSCNLSIFSVFVLRRFCCSMVLGFATHCLMVFGFCSNLLFNKGFKCCCSNCEGFELLIGSMYCCSNCGGSELLVGSRCCCLDCCSTKVLHLLLFNLFCFCDVESTKICVLGHFHPRLFTSFRNV